MTSDFDDVPLLPQLFATMKSSPLVSVLVTVYNREGYLPACLESILASSWTDFEVVVVDDQSSDGSYGIAMKFAERDPRVRVYLNEENLGDYSNRNQAAGHAKGFYLKYVDADDLIYPHGLEVMVRAMQAFPDAALGLSWNQTDPPAPYPFVNSARESMRHHFLGKSPLGCGPTGAILRKEAFEKVGGFSGRQFVGDSELWLKLAELWPVVSVPPALVWWRRHDGQQMCLEQSKPEVLTHRYDLQMEALMETKHLSSAEKHGAAQRLQQHHARRILRLALRGRQPAAAWQLFSHASMSLAQLCRGLLPYA